MPIRGLSEKRRLSRLGKIKLGVMVHPEGGRKPYPRATDYFVVPDAVAQVYGDRVTELPVMFPGETVELLFPQSLKMYRAAGLYCAGDGAIARRWTDAGELKEMTCPCPYLDSGECGPIATLNFLLPDVPGVGVWQITTGNQRSIVSLNTALEQFSRLFGGLSGIPFTLKLEPEPIQRFDDKSKRMLKQTLHVLRLDSPLTIREIVEWRQKTGKPVEALMPAPEPDDTEETARGAEEATPNASTGTVAQPDAAEEWDLSRCFACAKQLGVEATDYAAYLLGVYGTDVDNLPAAALAEQRVLFEHTQDAQARSALAAAMRQVGQKIQKRKNHQAELL